MRLRFQFLYPSICMLSLALLLAGCVARGIVNRRTATPPSSQTEQEIQQIQDNIQPSRQVIARVDRDLLWKAAEGYMLAAKFPLATIDPVGYRLETETIEWEYNRFPRRTRISVEFQIYGPKDVALSVVALKIEPDASLNSLKSGEAVAYTWTLQGSRPEVEVIILNQITRRYQLLLDGKDPDKEPLIDPIPGLSPAPNTLNPRSNAIPPGLSPGAQRSRGF